MNGMKKNRLLIQNSITYAIVIACWILVQILGATGHMTSLLKGLLVPLCIYVILAVSLNLTVGILGELSLGHAGFMCVGAFTGAFFTKCMTDVIPSVGMRFFLALLIGAAVAGVFGIIIGIPVLRLKGDYLAIVTLAFGEIIKNLINVLYVGMDSNGFHFSIKDTTSLGMGADGVVIIKGAQGITVGINITKYKLMAFAISAALAGVAGVLYAHNLSSLAATPKNFGYNMSIMILVFVVLGGLGNIRGSMIAAIILTMLPELLRGLNDYRMLIYAVVLIVMMIFNSSPKAIEMRSVFMDRIKKNKKSAKEAA